MMNPNQPEASSSKSHFFPSQPSPTPIHPSSEHGEPQYTFAHHPQPDDISFPASPPESTVSTSLIPNLREPPNPDLIPPPRPTLAQFRNTEGPGTRSAKLSALWESLPTLPELGDGPTDTAMMRLPDQGTMTALSPERAERLRRLYEEELVRRCNEKRPAARLWGGPDYQPRMQGGNVEPGKGIQYEDFRRFLWDQESQLWDIFQDLDKNGDGKLDAVEMRAALSRSGIDVTPATVTDLIRLLATGSKMSVMGKTTPTPAPSSLPTSNSGRMEESDNSIMSGPSGSSSSTAVDDMYITFHEFRDFLIMLPRKATPLEIYKFYQVRKRSDGRGAARVDKEGDISISFPKRAQPLPPTDRDRDLTEEAEYGDVVDEEAAPEERNEAWRFLLAGGLAGAVSRTVTAPFDRLKIYLITTDHVYIDPKAGLSHPLKTGSGAVRNLWAAMSRIYADGGGVRAFWVGNGLNIVKILPESAIKFLSYEQTKKVLARYWDRVSDPSELSSSSRFLAGGVGGITSQFAIYGLETLKTRIQSETGRVGSAGIAKIARMMWREGGLRQYYRGLTLGLIGVFPYSAIDMGTYETLKRAYCKSTGKDEPEVLATLGFGAMSGSIGAASVYPVNLLRTRLQASGSSGHPQKYTGFRDVLTQTLAKEGWRGLYKGLLPSIMKVGPAVGVSWIVYEDAKRRLGV